MRDATSGFRVYRRELLEELAARPIHARGLRLPDRARDARWHAGFDIGEVPITFREREHGQSKISRAIVVEALWLVTVWGVKARFAAPADRQA